MYISSEKDKDLVINLIKGNEPIILLTQSEYDKLSIYKVKFESLVTEIIGVISDYD